jgi:hypothetical protein
MTMKNQGKLTSRQEDGSDSEIIRIYYHMIDEKNVPFRIHLTSHSLTSVTHCNERAQLKRNLSTENFQ